MLGGIWLEDPRGRVGALFHMLNDAVATLALFLIVIAVKKSVGGRNLIQLKGLFQKSPLTALALILVAFNLIGVPPSAGFFSKVTLITGAISSGNFEFVAALLLASLGNLVIFFRILEIAYFNPIQPQKDEEGNLVSPRSEAGQKAGLLALFVTVMLFAMGLASNSIMDTFVRPVVTL